MHQELPEHAKKNRVVWDTWAADYAAWAPHAWAKDAPTWGIFQIPEAHLAASRNRWLGWMSSSWGAVPPTFQPGWHGVAHVQSASTTRLPS
jgi:hypothetical protein